MKAKSFLGKKAMTAGFLVAMIIVIASFMMIAATIMRFMSGAEEKQAEELCRESVAIRATAAVRAFGGEFKLSPLLCKTIDKKVKGDREEVQEVIANKMAKCWDMFGAGLYTTTVFENTNMFGNDNNCFLCYVLPVEKIRDDEGQKVITEDQFHDFLRSRDIPRAKGTSYLNYIQTKAGGDGYVATFLFPETGITEGRAYGIVYKGKKENCGDSCKYVIGAGIAVGAVLGGILYVVGGIVTIPATLIVGIVVVGGVTEAAFLVAAYNIVSDFLTADQPYFDGVLLVDLDPDTFGKAVYEECTAVQDLGGK